MNDPDPAANSEPNIAAKTAAENHDAEKAVDELHVTGESHDGEKPIMAKLASESREQQVAEPESEIREGSPFAVDPQKTPNQVAAQARRIEKFYDVGPLRYTAMGSVAASAMVIAFAAVACWWFPGGGALIAGLGCALAAFGLFSHLRFPAAFCLIVNLSLFVVSYSRILANA